MTHRSLGKSSLLVAKLLLGSWVDYNEKYTADSWYVIMKIAFERVNFFETSEMYGSGQAEGLLGGAIQKDIAEGIWNREDLVISTKLFTGPRDSIKVGPTTRGYRLGLIRLIVEQSPCNIFERNNVEFEFVDLYEKYKWGLTPGLQQVDG
ncbi:hypothetical protein JG687_00000925 [Phytophthora cactorum]|uniref:NADP-dependent oxidoreductase domain-containing protein n=1 Tax=Phytophthora cactorum TaxID=29920 RepID=A0A329SSQ3_9STRA|nr:hypothetical protein Pcac1_g7735 [Phytophthora cactorum]KAG2843012.1 hypothetical protein PC112_g2802 [Phytophthora cactorum]KAG2843892.1 hypothetical protein PC111_g2179 [Phytophthora cactorum]KAG2866032.1 hypothetical protein PC113_g3177 [Phytophthora cactorum]KAG2928437.1 hypothetical protein PC114_g3119 [Phytophthora cactorum]